MASPTTESQTLTVEEAARVLRIGRTAAYALAKEWRTTGGRSGLPVLELGRTLRVPRAALARLLEAPDIDSPESPATRPTSDAQRALWEG
jgi:excisionase family DNA binding protein